jgi:hypothetical protein
MRTSPKRSPKIGAKVRPRGPLAAPRTGAGPSPQFDVVLDLRLQLGFVRTSLWPIRLA